MNEEKKTDEKKQEDEVKEIPEFKGPTFKLEGFDIPTFKPAPGNVHRASDLLNILFTVLVFMKDPRVDDVLKNFDIVLNDAQGKQIFPRT